jgi:acyl-coenzyme A synthetase/AMP-(fatty) acid ligase
MASIATRRTEALAHHPLLVHAGPESVVAYRRGEPKTAAQFLRDVERTAAGLPSAGHVLNFCADRYRFAVLFYAALLRGQVTLLPPTTTPNVIAAMHAFAPDAYFVSDDASMQVDLPRAGLPADDSPAGSEYDVPRIAADQVVACLFTSGSTGEPQPHFKTWGALVRDAASEAARFEVRPGDTILGTVPPQHMYGFESTVLLPLLSGAALSAERPYYAAEIDEAIGKVAPRRILFTTPFHLRAWLASGSVARVETIVSATAPLSVALAREAEAATGATLLEIYGCTEAGQVGSRRPTHTVEWETYDGLRVTNEGEQTFVSGGHVERPTPLQDVIEVLGGNSVGSSLDHGTRFLLHGRLADMVNVAGKRNSLGYLNHQLVTIPGVVDGVFFLPEEHDEGRVTRLMAFAVAPGMKAAEVMARLRERIDPAFLPRPLTLVERLPRELTGKLPRAAVRALERKTRGSP